MGYGYGNGNYGAYGCDDDDDRGGNDEYTAEYCECCDAVTEHDVCTGECVEC